MSQVAPAVTLQVLLVEDDPADLAQYKRDLPDVFLAQNVGAVLDSCDDFDDALRRASSPLFRYDLIISDTYRGKTALGDAKVLEMVNSYRGHRFCPLVVYSSGVKPDSLIEGPFILWADKGRANDIERAIRTILATGVPQLARLLHDDIDRVGTSYLWTFLEANWARLSANAGLEPQVLERLLRRRAAIQIGRLDPTKTGAAELDEVEGLECYLYPSVSENFRLGEIIRRKDDGAFRIILTPHCHLTVQESKTEPRADFVLTARIFPAGDIIKRAVAPKSPWGGNEKEKMDKLRRRTQLSAELGKPDGRYCFFPAFLDVPDAYCDLLQLESVPYKSVIEDYDRVAVLDTPFAESLQASFTRFYSSVGLPNFNPERFKHLIQDETAPAGGTI